MRLAQPREVDVVRERGDGTGTRPRRSCYLIESPGDVVRALGLGHLSPRSGPLHGAAFARSGPSRRFPDVVARTRRSDFPRATPGFLASPRCFVRGRPRPAGGISPVPWCPLRCMPCSTTATRPRGHTPPGSRPESAPRDAAFRLLPGRRLSSLLTLRGPITQPARSLSTLRGHGRPCAAYDRARLASDFRRRLVGRDFNPLGHDSWFPRCLGYIASSSSGLGRTHRRSGSPGNFFPGPPQIRTCGTTASGSSCGGFATRRSLLWAERADTARAAVSSRTR